MSALELAASFDERFSPLAPFLLYLLVWGIVFLETGILVAFWLPGDSILFSAGLVAAARGDMNIVILVAGIFLAAFIGDQFGYVTGRKFGRPYLEKSHSPRIARMVSRSEKFYAKNGWWAVTAARFFPWFRTFIPPVAGVAKMPYYKFLSANSVGAFAWILLGKHSSSKNIFLRDCSVLYRWFSRINYLATYPFALIHVFANHQLILQHR
jgi:membrane-associated protein